MQQIPANALPEERQNDYRNCFIPGIKDWVVVGSDYNGQELAIVATLSRDPVFLDALINGNDLHSVGAEQVYGIDWKNAASPDCKFYEIGENGKPLNQKCKCKEHKVLRNNVKSINFGLAYGMSAKGLSAKLKIDLHEAENLIENYFNAFPSIKGTLQALGNYGTTHGYIRTGFPMRRKRYFPYWKGHDTHRTLMGKIERASMNAPIQGLAADQTKIAMVMLRRHVNKHNLRNKVQPFAQVHDQIDYICHKDIKDEWAKILTSKMEEAATLCLGNTLLKADTQISEVWQK